MVYSSISNDLLKRQLSNRLTIVMLQTVTLDLKIEVMMLTAKLKLILLVGMLIIQFRGGQTRFRFSNLEHDRKTRQCSEFSWLQLEVCRFKIRNQNRNRNKGSKLVTEIKVQNP